MTWDTGLTGTARDIAATSEKRLRVMAGPGTGKSFAMQRRVARLLEQGQNPSRILAVTFTRNAAESLVEDLTQIGVASCEKVQVGTLHSYCFSLLNRKDVFNYLNRVPRPIIALDFESSMMINDLVRAKASINKTDCKKRVLAFEAAWARLQSQQPGWPTNSNDHLFQALLIDWLRFHKGMLIGELVPEALRFLRNNPMSNALTAFDHVIVDEYQDLNRAEQEIVDLLAARCALAVVGDADQSIYSFRHANPEGIKDFRNRHHTTHDESLTDCRRCPTRVVEIANHLIAKNHPPSAPSRLRVIPSTPAGEIHMTQWQNPSEESQGLASYIKHLLTNRGYRPRDVLVITPRWLLADQIQAACDKKDISVYNFYQEKALKEKLAQRALALLTLLANREDRVALRWWLGRDSQTGLSGSYEKLREHCEKTGESPRQALETAVQGKLRLPKIILDNFIELEKELARLSGLNLQDLVDDLLPNGDHRFTALRAVAHVALLGSTNVGQLYDHIKTYITQSEVPEGDFVRVMSPHKAKGLTSKVVILTGCVQGLMPLNRDSGSKSEQDHHLHEQRRLFYVAITRCREVLVLSSVCFMPRNLAGKMLLDLKGHHPGYGETITSQFIHELGPSSPSPCAGEEWAAAGYV